MYSIHIPHLKLQGVPRELLKSVCLWETRKMQNMSWEGCFYFTEIGPFWDLVSKKIHNHSVIIHFWRLWRCIIAEISKIHWKSKIEKHQYYFANISATKAWIFMKIYVVSLSYKFCEDLCINAPARVVNARAHVLSRVKIWAFVAEIFAKQYRRLFNP